MAVRVRLCDEELEQVEQLAGIGYSAEQIAMYLDVPKKDFMQDFYDLESLIYYHYQRGLLLVDASSGMALATNAAAGNITADQQLEKKRKAQRLITLKNKILYGEDIA